MTKGSASRKTIAASASDLRDRTVLQVARKVAATIGADFFSSVAHHLVKALSADCVIVGEFIGGQMERVRTLGAELDGKPASFDYELAGSAAAQVALGKSCQYRAGAQSKFPSDPIIVQSGAEACVASPLLSSGQEPIGFMMALFRRTLISTRSTKELLDIFSARTAAELNHKRVEDQLRESEQRYRAFVATNADAMWRVEFEQPIDISLPEQEQLDLIYQRGYLAECNDSMARLVGREKAERVIGARVEEITPPSDLSIREANLLGIRSGHQFTSVETTWVDAQGVRRHMLRSQWGIVEDGQLERVWGTTRDITALKRSERALGASEQRMVNLLENVQLAVVMLNPDSSIAFCNQYFYRLTDWKPEQLSGKVWMELLLPAEERSRLRAVLSGGKAHSEAPLHFDSTLVGPDGRRWQFEWDRTVLRDADDRIAAFAHVGRDVTQYKALEEQFRQSQKLESIGRMAGGLAHSFNNLLTVIMGYSAALLENRDRSDAAFAGLTEIRKAAGRGAELTGRLLAFSRRHPVNRRSLSLSALIAETEPMLRRVISADIGLIVSIDPSVGFVSVVAGYFEQVLLNLAVNARDAMPQGGTLTISATHKEVDGRDPLWAAVLPGSYEVITVADTGMGMTDEVKSHLFEAFYTTKERGKGTGLGLSTVYGIVRDSGGQITVESAVGKGTVFTIVLPTTEPEAAPAQKMDAVEPAMRGAETILLVEDHEEVRSLAARILANFGYAILEADGASTALTIARDRGRTIQLLLTDVIMPEMNGFELADMVKTCHPKIKVLYMSGYTEPFRLAQRRVDPGFAYLQKPFTPESLAQHVRETLDQR